MEPYQIPENDQELARLHRTHYLIAAFIDDRLTPAEREELDYWVGTSTENLLFFEEATDEKNIQKFRSWYEKLDMEKARRRLLDRLETRKPRRRKLSLPFSIAACLVLLAGIATGFYLLTKGRSEENQFPIALEKGATLQLADGRVIYLDSVGNGRIDGTGELAFTKTGNEISFGSKADFPGNEQLNTLTVPKGKQYTLVLSDGTKVEVNAGSSLQFPYAFIGSERRVTLKGEGFFEVTKSVDHPFIVSAGQASVKVLGTEFNVNAYENESAVRTTLIEGSVNVSVDDQEIILKPGEEAVYENKIIRKDANADLQKATAWRSGEFIFRDTPLDEMLRTLERWYDIEVDNQAKRNERFSATFNKSWSVARITTYLEQTKRVHFTLNGKKLTVSD